MSDSEFDIIKNYFARLNQFESDSSVHKPDWLCLGIGDDAAIINSFPERQLVVAMDTLNSGIHFPEDTSAADIGYKALAVNLSDIAAMGAKPGWFTLSVSLPESNSEWLNAFCSGMSSLIDQYNLTLIGGDTTRGPLSITIQIAGYVELNQALTRSGAQSGDDIYVTGYLGEAAAGLKIIKDEIAQTGDAYNYLVQRLNRPTPRVAVGLSLQDIASACIDVSDGLLADLAHIIEQSHHLNGQVLGAELDVAALPVSRLFSECGIAAQEQRTLVLSGGDDYELCFTVDSSKRELISKLSVEHDINITRIGAVTDVEGIFLVDKNNKVLASETGYDHFK